MRVILKRIQTLLSGVYLIGEVRHCEIRFYEIRHGEIRFYEVRHGEIRNGEVHLVNAISPGRISPKLFFRSEENPKSRSFFYSFNCLFE